MAFDEASNIVLIGMPGSGKSTVGVLLAKRAAMAFVDTDLLIQVAAERPLQAIVDAEGPMALRRAEEKVLLGLDCRRHVIATGGSAVYSTSAMKHLGRTGRIVFLDVPLEDLLSRIKDYEERGIARLPGQSLKALFRERHPLYLRHAHVAIRCHGLGQEAVCEAILDRLERGVSRG